MAKKKQRRQAAQSATEPEYSSFVRYTEAFLDKNPRLRANYDPVAIATRMVDEGVPRGPNIDALAVKLSLDRRHHDPAWRRTTRQPRDSDKDSEEARRVKMALAYKTFREMGGTNYVMRDRRRVGLWSLGEVEKIGGTFDFIRDAAADVGISDPAKLVDEIVAAYEAGRGGKSDRNGDEARAA